MKKKIKIIIIIGVIVLALVGIGIWSKMSNKIKPNPPLTVGNTAGNLNNGGLFCETEDKIYFSNAYDNGCIYSMNLDGTELRRLIAANGKLLCADENALYYYQDSASGKAGLGYIRSTFGMYRLALDRSKKTTCLTRNAVYGMQLLGSHIYYSTVGDDSPEFRKVKIDKSEDVLLAKMAFNPACAANGQIYFNGTDTNHYLYSWNPQSDSSSEIWRGNLWYPVYDNGYIYYLDVPNNYRLARYNLSADSVEVLTHDRVDCFNLGHGYIYYQSNSETEPALKKMNLDGSQVEIVAAGNYTAINMTSRYVYFKMFGAETPIYQVPVGGTSVSAFDAALVAAMEHLEKK